MPPVAPQTLQAINGNKLVELFWPASSEADLEGYNVYRSTVAGSGFAKVNRWLLSGASSYKDNTVSNGLTYFYRVTAVDKSSNESAPTNAVASLSALYRGWYEEDSTGVEKEGTWNQWWPGGASGGYARYSSTAGSSVTMAIYGNSFKWVTVTRKWGGIAEVKIDPGQPEEETRYIDLYSSNELWQQNVLEKNWPADGLHTITIKVYGQKNPAASDYQVYLDGLEIGGSAEDRGRVEEDSITLDYTKTWSKYDNSGSSGNRYWGINRAGGAVKYDFYGTGIEWLANTNYNRGYARVTLDNEPPLLIDFYTPSEVKQNRVFKRHNLPLGKHAIKIEALGTKSATASGSYTTMDAFEVLLPVKDTPAVPEAVYATPGPSSVALNWNSAGPEVVGYRIHRYRGIIDDGIITPSLVRGENYTDTGLTPGAEYTYRVSAVGALGNESALSAAVYATPSVPGAGLPMPEGVTTLTAGVYQENDGRIIRSGNWWGSWPGGASGGYLLYGDGESTVATVYFQGTGIKWLARRYNGAGIGEVWIDGELAEKVSLHNSADQYQQAVFQRTHLPRGYHKVEIRATDGLPALKVRGRPCSRPKIIFLITRRRWLPPVWKAACITNP